MVDPGQSRVCVTVTAIQDNVDEPDETFAYILLGGIGYTLGGPASSSLIIEITPGRSKQEYILELFTIHFP